ncbi:MAG TPA: hypothetical protein VLB47_00065 [Solirubrobacteraceae bacterium]|nr:hypothetical protein [Solirubrobacteraceae bacterium]
MERVDARPCADGRWHVERRCPECEWRGAGRWPAEAYRELDDHLAAARAALLRLLARVEGSHARRDVDASVEALRRDRLGPGDV